jgi:glycosyltransferase involved in cell wall biosynthesis
VAGVDAGRLAERLEVDDLVVFAGFVDPVADVYAAADVVVNASRVSEGLGMVALEALAAGRPVVATRVGAVTEVLRDGREALLVEPDDAAALARAIERLWTDGNLRRRLVSEGRARVLRDFPEASGVNAFSRVVERVQRPLHGRDSASAGTATSE